MRHLILVVVLLAAGPAWATGLAIVVNSGDATLSVLDERTGTELRRVPVLREPHHVALSPDGKQLLIGDAGGNEMLFLDPQTGEIRRRLPVADPYHLQFSANGKWLVVTGLARNQVDVYDAPSMRLVKRFPASSMPSHITFSPDSSMAYATLQGTNRVAAYDLNQLKVVWTAEVGNTPAGILWHGNKLLVANMGTDSIAVVDPVDGRVEQLIRTGRGAHQIFLAPNGKLLWVNNRVDGTTVALDAASLKPLRTYRVPGGPDCIDFAADGKLWITQRFIQKVAVLDPATGELRSLPVGRSPHGIFLTEATRAQ
ncbi:MAG: beta-propeller fold lactonase family protein [Acetobacteraceae bacterium]